MTKDRIPGSVRNTFSALRHRNFRLLWIGTLISHSGDWMDQIALNWLVLELTGSPFYLGLMNLCRAIPILLFTLIGGVAADRFERRKLMLVTQSVAMILAFLLAISLSLGWVNIWLVLVIATLRGVMLSFNIPARQTIISDLVPRENLANAIALNSVTMNLTKIIGPALAGLVISIYGIAACFYINALSFLAVLWTLWVMVVPNVSRESMDKNLGQNLIDGFRFIRVHPIILSLVLVALVPTFFGQPYITMLTVFAYDVLDIGPAGLGLLTSCSSLGAVIGALFIASLGKVATRGVAMLFFMIAFGVLLIVFAFSTYAPFSILLITVVGAMNMAYNVSNNTLLQLNVPDEYRGRVLSTLSLNRGLVALGTAFAGVLATWVGAGLAVASMATIIVLIGIGLLVAVPSFRQLRV